MDHNYTDITILLDRSYSMMSCRQATINGFNEFIAEQRVAPGKCRVSLVYFADTIEPQVTGIDVKEIPLLNWNTYNPNGISTRLRDATCVSIDALGKRLELMSEDSRPAKVLFVSFTDGHENSSTLYEHYHMHERISHQRDKYSWKFLYLGANQDAVGVGAIHGYQPRESINYFSDAAGSKSIFRGLSNTVTSYRSANPQDAMSWNIAANVVKHDATLCCANSHLLDDASYGKMTKEDFEQAMQMQKAYADAKHEPNCQSFTACNNS